MKTYLYTFSASPAPRNGSGAKKTVLVYEVRRNIPHLVAERTDTFVDEFQLVQDALEAAKCKPAAMYAKHPQTGCGRLYWSARALAEAGVAAVHRVGF